MPISHMKHGLFAAPLIGAGRLSDIFAADNIYFVDAGVSRAGNGKSPDRAVTSITSAISAMSKDGTIYVKPRTTVAGAQTYYQEDIVAPVTKPNISIIGCGATYGNPNNRTGVQLKPLTVTGALITVAGAGLNLENLRLTMTGGTADTGKSCVDGVTSAAANQGLTIRACIFENCDKSHPSYSVGAVAVDTGTYLVVEDCFFINCLGGICGISTTGHQGRTIIRRNIFSGGAEARDCDILMALGDATYGMGMIIDSNIFADILPAHSGGSYGRFIIVTGAGGGMVSNNCFATTAATGAAQYGPTGTITTIPDTTFFVGNRNADAACVAAQS
jgi:hypothetical protein